jgi:hypothetical protein
MAARFSIVMALALSSWLGQETVIACSGQERTASSASASRLANLGYVMRADRWS